MQKLIRKCPSCGGEMIISSLTCSDCQLELRGQFTETESSPFAVLSEEQASFLLLFLDCRGNLKQVQERASLSYPAAKKKLDEVRGALGFTVETQGAEIKEVIDVNTWNINEDSRKASDIVKRKLRENGGRAIVTSFQGNEYEVIASLNGTEFRCSAVPMALEYMVFDIVVDFLRQNGGRAEKGTGRAALGSEKCGLDTIAGVILNQYFGVEPGGSAHDPSFAIIAILEWAGLVRNLRGEVKLVNE